MNNRMRVCIVIPTYNESMTISEIVAKIKKGGLDILVVDDGSQDETAKLARQNGASVIVFKQNRGKGASLKAGFKHALKKGYESIVVMDGDGQHDPEDIRRFIQTAKSTDADLIIGNRMNDTKTMPFVRWITNKWMSSFISRICGQKIPDTQCGFRFIKASLLEKVRLVSSKYETESELLIRAGRERFKILSIPIKSIYNNEVSAIHPIKDAFRFLRLMINIMFEKRYNKD